MRALTECKVLERRQESGFPGSVDYELGSGGKDLLDVARVLQCWLDHAPDGPLELSTTAAKNTTKAMVDGWSSAIVRALAARPLSLTELNRLISNLNYPSLERRLTALRLAGLIEACPGAGRGRPYAASPWLRQAVAPLMAGARWERRHLPLRAPAAGRIDFEAAFMLAVPLLELSSDLSGGCRLAVEVSTSNGDRAWAGVLAKVEDGQVASCVSRLRGDADAWAAGSPGAWFDALVGGELAGLEIGGASDLALTLLESLHDTLYGTHQLV